MVSINQELTAVASVRLLHFLSSLLKHISMQVLFTETIENVFVFCKE